TPSLHDALPIFQEPTVGSNQVRPSEEESAASASSFAPLVISATSTPLRMSSTAPQEATAIGSATQAMAAMVRWRVVFKAGYSPSRVSFGCSPSRKACETESFPKRKPNVMTESWDT